MARLVYGNLEETTQPGFMKDYRHREHILAGGAMLNEAAFTANADGRKFVEAGTIVGRTYAERDAGTGFGPVAFTAGTSVNDDEVYILAYDVQDAAVNAECDLVRHETLIAENYLPNWATLDTAVRTWVRDNYQTILGRE